MTLYQLRQHRTRVVGLVSSGLLAPLHLDRVDLEIQRREQQAARARLDANPHYRIDNLASSGENE